MKNMLGCNPVRTTAVNAAVALFIASVSGARAQTPFDPDGFNRRMSIVFEGYKGAETLANFPALIRLDANTTAEMGATQGADLRFADAFGAELNYEIDTWDDAAGESFVWVQVPALAPNAIIHAYWDNPLADVPAYSTNGAAWADGHILVQHYAKNLGTGGGAPVFDSSPTNQPSQFRANVTYTDGLIGQGLNVPWDGGIHNFSPIVKPGLAWTMSVWFKSMDVSGTRTLFRIRRTNDNGEETPVVVDGNANTLGNFYWNSAVTLQPDNPARWRQITTAFGGGRFVYYLDGEPILDIGNSAWGIAELMCVLNNINWSQRWAQYYDEFRLEGVTRSPAWVKTLYETVAKPGFAVCRAPVETGVADSVQTLSAIPIHNSAKIIGFLNDTAFLVSPQPLFVFYGETDEGDETNGNWDSGPVGFDVYAAGLFTNTLNGLNPVTDYHARFAYPDGHGGYVWSPESVAFTTIPNPTPVIHSVTANPGAAASIVEVEIEQLGIDSILYFMWDYADHGETLDGWAHISTNEFPDVDVAIPFNLPGFNPNDSIVWRVALTGLDNPIAWKSGAFTYNRFFDFIPTAGGAYAWDAPLDWELAGVPGVDTPRLKGDIARITRAGGAAAQTLGLNAEYKIGGLVFGAANIALEDAGNGLLVFDNGFAPAFLTKQNAVQYSRVNVPARLDSPLVIQSQNTATPVEFYSTVAAGNPAANIEITAGRLHWNPSSDTVFGPGIRGGFCKRGPHTLTLGGVNEMWGGFNTENNGFGLVEGGGSLVFDGGEFTNAAYGDTGSDAGRLFVGANGNITLSNGCQAVSWKSVSIGSIWNDRFSVTNNTLVATGAGTLLDMANYLISVAGFDNTLKVGNGASVNRINTLLVGRGNTGTRNRLLMADGASLGALNVKMEDTLGTIIVDNSTLAIGSSLTLQNSGNFLAVTNNSELIVPGNTFINNNDHTFLLADNNLPARLAMLQVYGVNHFVGITNATLECSGQIHILSGATDGLASGHLFKIKKGGVVRANNGFQMYGNGDVMDVAGGVLEVQSGSNNMGLRFSNRDGNSLRSNNVLRVSYGGRFKTRSGGIGTGWPNAVPVVIEAVGVDPETGAPSLCEPSNDNAEFSNPGFTLRAANNGVLAVTNTPGAAIIMNVAASPVFTNTLSTAGGEIRCNNLQMHGADSRLAPVVTTAHGTGKIVVAQNAAFAANTWVVPSAEKGAPSGEHTILTAGSLTSVPVLAPGFEELGWRLTSQTGANGWIKLRYSRGGTLLMVR